MSIETTVTIYKRDGETEIFTGVATVTEDDSVTVGFSLPDGKVMTVDAVIVEGD
jgi:hypothetical protein